MEKFSVLISVYAKEKPEYLALALESIYKQSLIPNEVVLVIDGEIPLDLQKVIETFQELKIVQLEVNKGLGNALNVGLQYCSFDIVARMDSDDICMYERFEKQMSFLEKHPDVDIVGTYATRIGDYCPKNLMKVPVCHDDIWRLVWVCPFIHPTVMFRKNRIMQIGNYNINAGPRQDDYELWFRCAENGLHFANIPISLLYYRSFVDSIKKNSIKVGWYRLKVGLHGCKQLRLPLMARLGVCIPFVRSLLPSPLNVYFQNLMDRINPRNKK